MQAEEMVNDSSSEEDSLDSQQPLNFVEEICCLLRLSLSCTRTAQDYFTLLRNSKTHRIEIEIMIAASIFLSSKIFESERKTRDILNMIFVVTKLHKLFLQHKESNEQSDEVIMDTIVKDERIEEIIQPNYSINSNTVERIDYNNYKAKILSAEQHLLRVIGFDFELAAKNTDELKTVLVLSHQLRCKLSFKIVPPMLAQVLVNTYNDIGGMNVQERKIESMVYFAYVLGKVFLALESENEKEFIIQDNEWETLFSISIETLKDEAGKIINWYEQHAKGNTVNRIEIVGENKTILNEDIVVEKGEQVIGDESLENKH